MGWAPAGFLGDELPSERYPNAQLLQRGLAGIRQGDILVVGVDHLITQLARCCKPAPPDPITGFVTRGRGVSIHRAECASLAHLASRNPERLLPAAWSGKLDREAAFQVDVAVRAKVPGAVHAVVRDLDGRPVVWVDVETTDRRGALSSASSSVIEAAAVTARGERLPFVCVMRSSGADIVEGIAALHGWGRAARALTDCSGIVPTVFIVDGPAVSGPALLLGIADHVVMTEGAYAFVSGPAMVAEFTGVVIDNDELGGAASHEIGRAHV